MSESPAVGCSEESCMITTVDSFLTDSLCSRSGKSKTSECNSNYLGKKETTSTRLGILTEVKGAYAYLKDANDGK